MLTDADLPAPWRVVDSPIPQADAEALDAAAGLKTTIEDPVSWDLIENSETGRRVMLRMAADDSGPAITGVYVPAGAPGPPGIGEVRQLPLAPIEAAVRGRTAHSRAMLHAALAAGPDASEGKLGRPSGPNDQRFFARVAMRYADTAQTSNRPAVDLAAAEGVTPRTVQRWTARARQLGLLPPGRPGRVS